MNGPRSFSKIMAGKRSKHEGDLFEMQLKMQSKAHGWKVIQIPMGAKMLNAHKLIRVQTPFDFVFVKRGKALFADAKSFQKPTISFSDLTHHQIENLFHVEQHGFKAGYIVNFRKLDQIRFYPASMLLELKQRSSYGHEDGFLMGSVQNISLDCLF